jgi:hypothetical protein
MRERDKNSLFFEERSVKLSKEDQYKILTK